jgi:hypothetical protein
MAQTIVNKDYSDPSASFLPGLSIPDQALVAGTKTTAVVDTGIAGLKSIRARIIFKTLTGLAAGDTLTIIIQAGTGAAITNPTNIAQAVVKMATGDTMILVQLFGWSNVGFQSYKIIVTGSGGDETLTFDAIVDVGP